MPTIRETAEEYLGEEIDIDVSDTDIDMAVCLCHTLGDTNDSMDKFLELLCNNVIVTKFVPKTENNLAYMVCDFSGFYRIYSEKIADWIKEVGLVRCGEFADDEPEYELTNITPQLISGDASESLYASLLKVFTEE